MKNKYLRQLVSLKSKLIAYQSWKRYFQRIGHDIGVRKTLIVVSVIAITIFTFIPLTSLVSGKNVLPKMFGHRLPISDPHTVVLAVEMQENSDTAGIELVLDTLILPKTSDSGHTLCVSTIQVEKAEFSSSPVSELREPMIDDLWDFGGEEKGGGGSVHGGGSTINLSPICSDENQITVHRLNDYDIFLNTSSTSAFFFPFDKKYINFVVVVTESNNEYIAPEVIGIIESKEWDQRVIIKKLQMSKIDGIVWLDIPNDSMVSLVEVSFVRPLAYRILIPMLILVLAMIIIATLFLESLGDFFQVIIGILLGLWGLKSALVPSVVPGPTIVDGLILDLYVLLALFLVFRFTLKPLWRKQEESKEQ